MAANAVKIPFTEGSAPSTPAANKVVIYAKSDGLMYSKDDAGVETVMSGGGTPSGSITASGYTQNTARLLGRTTGSAGAIEEITVGTGLSLSAGSLTATGGGSVVPNLIMDYTQSSDISGTALSTATWVDVVANQNFTVANASSVICVSVAGFAFNNVSALQQSARFVVDSAGTPINRQVGGYYMSAAAQGNFFSGAQPVYLTGLTAAVHTIKIQAFSSNGTPGAFYCRPSGNPPEYLTIQIVEFLPA